MYCSTSFKDRFIYSDHALMHYIVLSWLIPSDDLISYALLLLFLRIEMSNILPLMF
jgi:hypothetical protein